MTKPTGWAVIGVMEGLVHAPQTPTIRDQADNRDALENRLRAVVPDLSTHRHRALEAIWNLCADDLYSLALWRAGCADDAEDAVQEVFVRLARRPEGLQRARNPRTYLMRMAHNAAVDEMKKRQPREGTGSEPLLAVVDPQVEITADAATASALLAKLPVAQREVVCLRHFAELSFREIATVCKVPVFTAASRYRLGLQRLRRLMGE